MKVLILTAKYGMGHYTASISLEQEIKSQDTEVEVVDFFDVIFPRMKTVIYGVFDFLVSKCSNVYNFFYRFSANSNFVPLNKLLKKRIENLIDEKYPDIIISTFPVCTKYIASYKKKNNSFLKLYTYITDVEANKEWISKEIDIYFVGTYETKKQIVNYGVSSEKIKVVGIPVRKEFKEINYEKRKNEVVIMGGGLGLIPDIEKSLASLSKVRNIHITLLTGKNEKLFNKYYGKYKNVTVVAYTSEVYKYMKEAELIITKAGGITLFEAIHAKTPMYILTPFLSQEIGNAKFIENNKIGVVNWNRSKELSNDIIELLEENETLDDMRENMQNIKDRLEILNAVDVYRKECCEVC